MKPQGNTPLTRSKAIQMVAVATRPDGMPAAQWGNVKLLLLVIAEHYPRAFPSRATIAAALGKSEATVKRYIKLATDAGLIQTYQRQVWSGRYGSNHYVLRYHHRGSSVTLGPWVTHDPLTVTDTDVSVTHSTEEALRASSSKFGNHRRRGGGKKGTPNVSDYDPDFENKDIARKEREEAEAFAQPRKKPGSVYRTPAARVTHHFRDEWERLLLQPGGTYISMLVLFDSVAAFQARVKQDCFEKEGRSVEEVCANIDLYLAQVLVRREVPKDGQPVWKHWWSRRAKYQYLPAQASKLYKPTLEDHKRRLQGGA